MLWKCWSTVTSHSTQNGKYFPPLASSTRICPEIESDIFLCSTDKVSGLASFEISRRTAYIKHVTLKLLCLEQRKGEYCSYGRTSEDMLPCALKTKYHGQCVLFQTFLSFLDGSSSISTERTSDMKKRLVTFVEPVQRLEALLKNGTDCMPVLETWAGGGIGVAVISELVPDFKIWS